MKLLCTLSLLFCLGPAFLFGQQKGCDPKLWNYVYNEPILHITKSCLTVKGTVYTKTNEQDGCTMLRILLDPGQEGLINEANTRSQYGCIPAMIICACKAKLPEAVVACSKYTNNIAVPERGAHVAITGTLVQNFEHGWMEIHPVSLIRLLN